MTEELSYVLINDLGQRYVEIPVHKATRVFFQREFGHSNEFVKARLDNLLGSGILMVIEKPIYRRVLLRRRSRECKLKVVLPKEVKFGKVTAEMAVAMGKMLDAMYRHQFFCFVKGAVNTGCSENFAVIKFLEVYRINEDVWALDTAKKAWRDYKCRANV
jgi:hypothetical protein